MVKTAANIFSNSNWGLINLANRIRRSLRRRFNITAVVAVVVFVVVVVVVVVVVGVVFVVVVVLLLSLLRSLQLLPDTLGNFSKKSLFSVRLLYVQKSAVMDHQPTSGKLWNRLCLRLMFHL